MNLPVPKTFPAFVRRWGLCVLLALSAPGAFAQADTGSRWLFVFEVSPAMQKRLPATVAALTNFFADTTGARLHDGDSVGVWTFDGNLHTGQLPLATWQAAEASNLAADLADFLRKQKPAGTARLTVLQPSLNAVVADSARLTVVIFCDGESGLTNTIYDAGVNQMFTDRRAERKRNAQPFVVALRSLNGNYLGCTVNFPPGTINLPAFPPPPPVTNQPPRVVVTPKPAPAPVAQDLVIVGTRVTGTPPPQPKISGAESPEASAAPPKSTDTVQTIPLPPPTPAPLPEPAVEVKPSAPVTSVAPPVSVPVKVAPTNPPLPATNAVVAAAGTDREASHLFIAAVVLVAVAVVVGIWIFAAGRRPRSSLITDSMRDDQRRK
jgi:hypothetical protein